MKVKQEQATIFERNCGFWSSKITGKLAGKCKPKNSKFWDISKICTHSTGRLNIRSNYAKLGATSRKFGKKAKV